MSDSYECPHCHREIVLLTLYDRPPDKVTCPGCHHTFRPGGVLGEGGVLDSGTDGM
jgi:ribosomal protein S27E